MDRDLAAEHPDLDRLAELDAGLLEAPMSALVRQHLDGCLGCRGALAALVEVRRALSTAPPEVMPADVAARIDAAVRVAGARAATTLQPHLVRSATRSATGSAAGSGVGVRGRRPAWSGGLLAGAAAAAVAILLVGAVVLGSLRGSGPSNSASRASGARAGAPSPGPTGPVPVTTSDRNYTADTLGAAPPPQSMVPDAGSALRSSAGAAALDRLRQPAALAACLQVLTGRPGVRPSRVELARYQGAPAAVIVVPVAAHPPSSLVYVVGPACGPGDSDLRNVIRVPRS